MLTLISPSQNSICVIAPEAGGRIESLRCLTDKDDPTSHRELLVGRHDVADHDHDHDHDLFSWGCFTMVPYCGRVRDGIMKFNNETYELPRRQGAHAIHGSVINQNWVVLQCTPSSATLACELGPEWPFEGTVHHEISLSDSALLMTVTISTQQLMPAQIGWHPWFRPPIDFTLPFGAMLKRDDDGITTSETTTFDSARRGIYDDCFIEANNAIILHYLDVDVTLDSDCSHWVVFDQRRIGVCFEPQSGPPNGVNERPEVVPVNGQLSRWFEIRWRDRIEI